VREARRDSITAATSVVDDDADDAADDGDGGGEEEWETSSSLLLVGRTPWSSPKGAEEGGAPAMERSLLKNKAQRGEEGQKINRC